MPSSPTFKLDNKIASPVRSPNLNDFKGKIYLFDALKTKEEIDDLVRGYIRVQLDVPAPTPGRTDASFIRAFSTRDCECGDSVIRSEINVDDGCCLSEMSEWEVVFIPNILGKNGNRGFLCFFDSFGGHEVITYLPRGERESAKSLDDAVMWLQCMQRMVEKGFITKQAQGVWKGGLAETENGRDNAEDVRHFERIFKAVIDTFEGNYYEEGWWKWAARVLRLW